MAKTKEAPAPTPKAPAQEAMERALAEGERRTQEYEATLDPRQRPAWNPLNLCIS
ncbi:hypothetical protein [Mesoterricola silvestris]|uniref:hypothetical protein n=1 Tax=Mesoterricola silvestris TaxID=2927979 RepID=UPI0029301DB0|nr:hypothetical protein [Mesoterricola silvestris]